jgi:predicted nucleic acid-binding protein
LIALVSEPRVLSAPYLLQVEFFSAVRRLEKRGRVGAVEASKALTTFRAIPCRFGWSESWVDRAIEIARAYGLSTVYDAVYLAAAEEQNAELYTCDANFCAAFGAELPARIKLIQGA